MNVICLLCHWKLISSSIVAEARLILNQLYFSIASEVVLSHCGERGRERERERTVNHNKNMSYDSVHSDLKILILTTCLFPQLIIPNSLVKTCI